MRRGRLENSQSRQRKLGKVGDGRFFQADFESERFRRLLKRENRVRRRDLLQYQFGGERNAMQMAHPLEPPGKCVGRE
jgi:hypothetical protein